MNMSSLLPLDVFKSDGKKHCKPVKFITSLSGKLTFDVFKTDGKNM